MAQSQAPISPGAAASKAQLQQLLHSHQQGLTGGAGVPMQQQPHHQHHHMPSSQQGKFGLDEGRLLGGPGEGAGSMSVTGTGDGTGTGMGSNIYNRARQAAFPCILARISHHICVPRWHES